MGHTHLSRRDILKRIHILSTGTALLPLYGQKPDTSRPGVIKGSITDAATGQPTSAKLRVVDTATGQAYMPANAIKTMPQKSGPGVRHYFYARGNYEIAVPPGRFRIEAVRGICHDEAVEFSEVGSGITHVHDFRIPLLKDMHGSGWYSGNTHTHYHLEIDEDPDDRLRMVPPAEDLDVSIISYLIRNDAPYITNRYPVGELPQFSRGGTFMDMGEEARNNRGFGDFGYGHVLFVGIRRAIEPVSTGLLSKDGKAPDFPTLSMLCEEAKKAGGTTIWCHNGSGMEYPVAVAYGVLDAFNLGDGLNADYQSYYRILNCGFKLPASSGTDWWIYDHNRVFAKIDGAFTYAKWLAAIRAGRTFISNGPLLELEVNGKGPGDTVTDPGRLHITARALSRLPFDKIEIVQNGEVVAEQHSIGGRESKLEADLAVERGGWIAARIASNAKTHANFGVFAHTSPVYLRLAGTPYRLAHAAGAVVDDLENSMRFLRKVYKFASDADKATAIGRFQEARNRYAALIAQA